MAKIKAVLFDLDGTIGNTLPLIITAFRRSLEPLINRTVSDAEIIATFGPSEEGTIMSLAPDHYDRGLSDYLSFYEELHHICPEPFEGIREMLVSLRYQNVRLGMVTGKGERSAMITLKKFDLEHHFEIIETGSPYGPRKPEGIRAALEIFSNISEEETIYVGDAPSDIESSRQAGVSIVSAAWADTAELNQLKALGPDQLFDSIPLFKEWLYARI